MNSLFRSIIAGGLILLGGTSVMAQESSRAAQVVSFAVHRVDAFSLQDRLVQKETATNSPTMKITVHVSDESLKSDTFIPAGNAHMDLAVVRSRESDITFKSKSLLLTITD